MQNLRLMTYSEVLILGARVVVAALLAVGSNPLLLILLWSQNY